MAEPAPLLALTSLDVYYGPIPAVRDVSLQVERAQIVALLGANGAGKTSTLRAVAGLVKPRRPAVTFDGRSLTGVTSERRVRLGIATVPEEAELFRSLTVEENLRAGAYARRDRREVKTDIERVFAHYSDLHRHRRTRAGALSGGQAQMLALGRALMARPRLLILDEPSHGLAPRLIDQVFHHIARINREENVAVLLVEQNASRALEIASYGYVLQNGRLALEGTAMSLRQSEQVRELYLGG